MGLKSSGTNSADESQVMCGERGSALVTWAGSFLSPSLALPSFLTNSLYVALKEYPLGHMRRLGADVRQYWSRSLPAGRRYLNVLAIAVYIRLTKP